MHFPSVTIHQYMTSIKTPCTLNFYNNHNNNNYHHEENKNDNWKKKKKLYHGNKIFYHDRSRIQTFPTPPDRSPSGCGRGITTFTKVPAHVVKVKSVS